MRHKAASQLGPGVLQCTSLPRPQQGLWGTGALRAHPALPGYASVPSPTPLSHVIYLFEKGSTEQTDVRPNQLQLTLLQTARETSLARTGKRELSGRHNTEAINPKLSFKK